MSESAAQRKAINYAKRLGFLARRNYLGPGTEAGWPDVEIFLPAGRVLLLEMKARGKKARKLQEYRIKRLRKLGHDAFVCDSFEAAKERIDAAGAAALQALESP